MCLRLTVSIIVLVTLIAHWPSFAKEVHPQHSAHAIASRGASGKNPNGKSPSVSSPSVRGPSANGPSAASLTTRGANPTESKSNSLIDLEATVPPPVLPPQGFARQRGRNAISSVKIVTPGNSAAHDRAGAITPHAVRNAIGQLVIQSKNFPAAQAQVSAALRTLGVMPPVWRGAIAPAPVVSSVPGHPNTPAVNVASLASRSSNGAGVIRPAMPPSGVGGPARPTYGINGTTVQDKH